jgi:hypothetical protein
MKYKAYITLCIAAIVILGLVIGPRTPRSDEEPTVELAQKETDMELANFGQMILDYRKEHGGKSPVQVSELFAADEVDKQNTRHHVIDTYVKDPIDSFRLPTNSKSDVLIYERPGLWSDGTIAVCFSNLTVNRFTLVQFEALYK